jgi:hypothetical protein
MLWSTLNCRQIYADLGDLAEIAVGLLRQNGSSPTTEVQLAHQELITKLRRLDFWIISSQDRSFHNQKNAQYLAPTTTIPRRDVPISDPSTVADSDRCQIQRPGQLRHCILHLRGHAINVAYLRAVVSARI